MNLARALLAPEIDLGELDDGLEANEIRLSNAGQTRRWIVWLKTGEGLFASRSSLGAGPSPDELAKFFHDLRLQPKEARSDRWLQPPHLLAVACGAAIRMMEEGRGTEEALSDVLQVLVDTHWHGNLLTPEVVADLAGFHRGTRRWRGFRWRCPWSVEPCPSHPADRNKESPCWKASPRQSPSGVGGTTPCWCPAWSTWRSSWRCASRRGPPTPSSAWTPCRADSKSPRHGSVRSGSRFLPPRRCSPWQTEPATGRLWPKWPRRAFSRSSLVTSGSRETWNPESSIVPSPFYRGVRTRWPRSFARAATSSTTSLWSGCTPGTREAPQVVLRVVGDLFDASGIVADGGEPVRRRASIADLAEQLEGIGAPPRGWLPFALAEAELEDRSSRLAAFLAKTRLQKADATALFDDVCEGVRRAIAQGRLNEAHRRLVEAWSSGAVARPEKAVAMAAKLDEVAAEEFLSWAPTVARLAAELDQAAPPAASRLRGNYWHTLAARRRGEVGQEALEMLDGLRGEDRRRVADLWLPEIARLEKSASSKALITALGALVDPGEAEQRFHYNVGRLVLGRRFGSLELEEAVAQAERVLHGPGSRPLLKRALVKLLPSEPRPRIGAVTGLLLAAFGVAVDQARDRDRAARSDVERSRPGAGRRPAASA